MRFKDIVNINRQLRKQTDNNSPVHSTRRVYVIIRAQPTNIVGYLGFVGKEQTNEIQTIKISFTT
jgi:hypothetical protein